MTLFLSVHFDAKMAYSKRVGSTKCQKMYKSTKASCGRVCLAPAVKGNVIEMNSRELTLYARLVGSERARLRNRFL